MTHPSSVPQLPQVLAQYRQESAVVRMGTVAEVHSGYLLVYIADSLQPIEAGWVIGYQPVIGDVVTISRQGTTWVVLGGMGAFSSEMSALSNYSFEDGAIGNPPPNWTLVATAGSPTLTTVAYDRDDPIDGYQMADLNAPSTTTVTLNMLSDPVRVQPGQQWVVGAWYRTLNNFNQGTTCSIQVFASWYEDTDPDTLISSAGSGVLPVMRGQSWRVLSSQGTAGRVAPADAAWLRLRVAVNWSATAGDTIYFDRMIARQV